MKRIFIPLFLYFLLFVDADKACCTEISAEQQVENFYSWYITERIHSKCPINNDDIEKYVNHCVVNNIRIFYKRAYFDADYFTKSQDIWDEWLNDVVVHAATKINDSTSIVPISFKFSNNLQQDLIVFVQTSNKGPRITKVIGANNVTE